LYKCDQPLTPDEESEEEESEEEELELMFKEDYNALNAF
jgi:hypothetical protein